MPLLFPLIGALLRLAWPVVLKVLLWLGFSSVTYVGVQSGLQALVDTLVSYGSTLPAGAFQMMGLLKVDLALSLMLSGYVFKLVRSGMSLAGPVRKLVRR